jgi:hypothetical protein
MPAEAMKPESLAGRLLDAEVARVLGWTAIGLWTSDTDDAPTPDDWFGVPPKDWPGRETVTFRGHERTAVTPLPTFSADSCSGLAPVLAWLEANAPTKEQVDAIYGVDSDEGALLMFERGTEEWQVSYDPCFVYDGPHGGAVICLSYGDSLPPAACRLLVAWAAKRSTT